MPGRRKSKSGGSADLAIGLLILFVIGVVITYWKTILLVLLILGMGILIYALIKYLVSQQNTQAKQNTQGSAISSVDIYVSQQKSVLPSQKAHSLSLPTQRLDQTTETTASRPVEISLRTASLTPEEVEAELNRLEAIVKR